MEAAAMESDTSVRRVVTGHDETGKAIVLLDGAAPNAKVRAAAGGLISTLLWVADETPADIEGHQDRAEREIGVAPPAGGSIFRMVEFPPMPTGSSLKNAEVLREMGIDPGAAAAPRHPFMHRTKSIDYAIVVSGEIYMLLDDSEVLLRAGDVVVQQGTNHAWENRGQTNCRMAFVLIDAKAPAVWGEEPTGH